MDGLLSLVAMLPQKDIADPLPKFWPQKAIFNLLLNDIIWVGNKHVLSMRDRVEPGCGGLQFYLLLVGLQVS